MTCRLAGQMVQPAVSRLRRPCVGAALIAPILCRKTSSSDGAGGGGRRLGRERRRGFGFVVLAEALIKLFLLGEMQAQHGV
jgi:hypothetical protein